MAAFCGHRNNNKHREFLYMLNQNIVEKEGKARLVVRGFEEASEKGLVSAEQFAVQSFDLSGVVLYCQGCEAGWIFLILTIVQLVLEAVNAVTEYRFSILVTALAILAFGSLLHRRAEERRHDHERQQQQQARARYLRGRNISRATATDSKRKQVRGAPPQEPLCEQDVRWIFVAEGLYELAVKRRKAEAVRDLWSSWARLANKLRGHAWENIRKNLERTFGKTAPKQGPSARSRVPF